MAQDQLFPLEEIKAGSNWRRTKLAFCFAHSLIVCGAFYVLHMPDVIAMIDAMYRVNRHQFNSSPASERHVDLDQAGLSGAQRETRRGVPDAVSLLRLCTAKSRHCVTLPDHR